MLDQQVKEIQKQLPFLPGASYKLHEPQNYRKSHTLDYTNKVPIYRGEKPGIGGSQLNATETQNVKTSTDFFRQSGVTSEKLPTWVAFDRQVLRFYAYFQESVLERREEDHRVRGVNIYFYLEDDTIHVSEPRVMNSGLSQGTLIRRHRIPVQTGDCKQHFTVADLNVGKEVTFYARTYRIIGCDEFTRQFLAKAGVEVPTNSFPPSDPYTVHRQELQARMRATRPVPINNSLKKFLENDRQVLRFHCVWDDSHSSFGDLRRLTLHYFLADDTIEIQEHHQPNCGRDGNTNFLKRDKLPKHLHHLNLGSGAEHPEGYYTEQDLMIGSVVNCYGRSLVIVNCDEFTKHYYHEKYGVAYFEPIPEDVFHEIDYETGATNDSAHANQTGTVAFDEDPENLRALVPKPAKKDFKKMLKYDNTVMRFVAKLDSGKQVDKDRHFILSFYMADDTFQVFERQQKNTGISGGKFLERSKLKTPDGKFYGAQDLHLGATLVFWSHPFVLVDADDFTKKYMKEHTECFPLAS